MSAVQAMPHVPNPLLSVEREFDEGGREFILIEGVKYEADYFRTFSHPEVDVLYAVVREEDFLKLTVIDTPERAQEFFENA